MYQAEWTLIYSVV